MLQVFRWFCDLSDRRARPHTVEPHVDTVTNKPGWRVKARPQPIDFPDITAWVRINGVNLAPWQVAAITLLDDRFIEVENTPIVPVGDGGKSAIEFLKRHAKPKKKRT